MSAQVQFRDQYDFDTYLAIEREQELRHEFVAGQVYAMTGASENHNLIVANLVMTIGAQLKTKPCRLYANDMKVRIELADASTYPDIVALCGEREFYDQRRDVITNPALIIEVLSKSTEGYDRGDKFAIYRRLPSLREYALISQDRVAIDVYSRQSDGRWLLSAFDQIEQIITLESVGCDLPVAEVYDKVEFLSEAEAQGANPR